MNPFLGKTLMKAPVRSRSQARVSRPFTACHLNLEFLETRDHPSDTFLGMAYWSLLPVGMSQGATDGTTAELSAALGQAEAAADAGALSNALGLAGQSPMRPGDPSAAWPDNLTGHQVFQSNPVIGDGADPNGGLNGLGERILGGSGGAMSAPANLAARLTQPRSDGDHVTVEITWTYDETNAIAFNVDRSSSDNPGVEMLIGVVRYVRHKTDYAYVDHPAQGPTYSYSVAAVGIGNQSPFAGPIDVVTHPTYG